MDSGFLIKQMFTPSWAGKKISKGTGEIIQMMSFFAKAAKTVREHKNCIEVETIKSMDGFPKLASSSEWRQAEFSSANFQANARGCAKLASIMASKGASLMSEETWNEMHSEPTLAKMMKFPGEKEI